MFKSRMSQTALCVVVLMIAVTCGHAALTSGEVTALGQIRSAFPALTNPLQDYNWYFFFNGTTNPWPSGDLSSICSGPTDGYDVHGVYCQSGHVAGFYFFDGWGHIDTSKSLDQLSGLTHLTNLSVNTLSVVKINSYNMVDAFVAFSTAIFHSVSLQNLDCGSNFPRTPAWDALIPTLTSLNTLRLNYRVPTTPDLTNLTVLYSLELGTCDDLVDLTPFLPLAPHLQHLLLFNGRGPIANLSALVDMTSLVEFTVYCDGSTVLDDKFLLPPNLVSLYVSNAPVDPVEIVATGTKFTKLRWYAYTTLELTGIPSTIVSLDLYTNRYPAGLNFTFPPGLQILQVAGSLTVQYVHPSIGYCTELSQLLFSNSATDLTGWISALPYLRSTQLSTFAFSHGSTNLSALLCDLADPSRITSLTLAEGDALPSCNRTQPYNSLKYLKIQPTSYSVEDVTAMYRLLPRTLETLYVVHRYNLPLSGSIDWDDFVDTLPMLKSLTFQYSPLSGTFPSQLMRLSSIHTLYFQHNSLQGTIPEDFFQELPQLTEFRIVSNEINGTFPWYGLQNIQTIQATLNQLEAWPSVAGGAPNLVEALFDSNQLTQIPDDISFSQMPKLQRLTFSLNADLSGPVPTLWADHPSIQTFDISGCNMSGTVPSTIVSRHLINLVLGSNQFCGPLPTFPSPRGLFQLAVNKNRFSGTYPHSWSQNLSIGSTLDVSENFLNGTISTLMNWISRPRTVKISKNFFSGSVPDFALQPSTYNVGLSDNSFDMCAASPNFTYPSMICSVGNNAVDACNCDTFYAACSLNCLSVAPPASITYPTADDFACVNPPARPAARPIPGAPSTPPPTGTSAAQSSFAFQFSTLVIGFAVSAFFY